MVMLSSFLIKGENVEWLFLVKEENRLCVNLVKLNLYFIKLSFLYDFG